MVYFFPEFEKYSIPEDLIPLGGFALPGLACFPQAPHLCEDDLEKFDPLPNPSPVKMPERSGIYWSCIRPYQLRMKTIFNKVSVCDLYNETEVAYIDKILSLYVI